MPVQVHFLPDNVAIEAEVGEPLLQVADRAGLSIPTGCLMGSCHACEVEIEAVTDCETNSEINSETVCACISAVPAGCSKLTINLYVDPTW